MILGPLTSAGIVERILWPTRIAAIFANILKWPGKPIILPPAPRLVSQPPESNSANCSAINPARLPEVTPQISTTPGEATRPTGLLDQFIL
jgi:hypothetical protein